jgi:hypothetical protein
VRLKTPNPGILGHMEKGKNIESGKRDEPPHLLSQNHKNNSRFLSRRSKRQEDVE